MAAEAAAVSSDPVAGLLLKLRSRDILSEHEEEVLRASIGEVADFRPGRTIVRAGASLTQSVLVLEGLVARYKDMSDGQRQIVEIHLSGDFVDLHGFLLKRLEHHVGTLSQARVAFVPHDCLRRITEEEPHLARMLWFSTLIDAAIQREKILSIGRRTAIARVAHLLCELAVRLETVGLAAGGRFALPLTQLDLADATGLTSVHVNRMLRKLRDEGLLTFRGGDVVIHDWDRLQRLAEFDPAYLYLERRPR
jgi:CRP-like cAMP-binding protein